MDNKRPLLNPIKKRLLVIINTYLQIVGFLSVAGVLSAGIYGATQIEALYDPIWYLREDSYPAQFLYAMEDYFPSQGVAVSVYVGEGSIALKHRAG